MIQANFCTVSAQFDSGTFMYFGVTVPLKEEQYTSSIQTEYNLSYGDFTALEILIAGTVSDYLKRKNDGNND
jgi:hypothetical protein